MPGGTDTGTGRLNVAKGVSGDVGLIPADHFGRKVGIVGQPSAAHGIVKGGIRRRAEGGVGEEHHLGMLFVADDG